MIPVMTCTVMDKPGNPLQNFGHIITFAYGTVTKNTDR